jgi:predicted transcriptional regulator
MTSNLKKEIIELIKKLPENATIDDIMYHLYVKKKILAGIEDIEQGRIIPHEQVMESAKKRLEQWLK